MKKIISIISIIAAFTACSNNSVQETKVELVNRNNLYMKNGKAFSIIDDQLFTGVTMAKDDYYDVVKVTKYVKGEKKEFKNIKDNELTQKITFNNEGDVAGDFYFKNNSKVFEGKLVNGLFQGQVKDTYYGNKKTVSYVNSVLHGIMESTEDGKTTVSYYNKGMKVDSLEKVEKFEESTLPVNPKLYSLLKKDEESMIYKDENGQVFDGIAMEKDYDEYSYYTFKEGKLVEKLSYTENYFDSYDTDYSYYVPSQMIKYNEDGSSAMTTYDTYSNIGEVERYSEYDPEGKVHGKVIEYNWDGSRIEKYEYNGELLGEAHIYDEKGRLSEIHNYEKDRYTIVGYYDIDKGIKKVEGQGIKDKNGYHRTGKWKWFYENGNVNQEVDFYYYDNYAMSKVYYEDGTLKEEGKMTYCACDYVGEVRKYDSEGNLSSIDIYDSEGNGELINSSDK